MKVCIIGGGASGWMAVHQLKHLENIDELVIVTSDKIPPIGVGESTTVQMLSHLYKSFDFNFNTPSREALQFLVDTDSVFKAGVSYEGWGNKNFLHVFVPSKTPVETYRLLANLSDDEHINDYTSPTVNLAYQHRITQQYALNSYDDIDPYHQSKTFPYTIHFDANKFIKKMWSLAESEEKIKIKIGTAVDLIYDDDIAKTLVLDNGETIDADYFVSCVGQTAFNQRLFNEEYKSYSDVLLTNKAVVTPLQYTDKPNQFHPYTVAKTMKNGWRWITPIWSRIGTGYVFSDNHISVDEAKEELVKDIGFEPNVEPFVVDFTPRKILNPFKKNTCTVGMAAGFLEPLDAPGLSLTSRAIILLEDVLNDRINIEDANQSLDNSYNQWMSFILLQYKTCHRNDTQFWIDHKNVESEIFNEKYNEIISGKHFSKYPRERLVQEPSMYYITMKGKGINWDVDTDALPEKVKQPKSSVDHYTYFKGLHQIFK